MERACATPICALEIGKVRVSIADIAEMAAGIGREGLIKMSDDTQED